MHIFAILTNVLKEFDLKTKDMLIFVIINHCCGALGFFLNCPLQRSLCKQWEYYKDFPHISVWICVCRVIFFFWFRCHFVYAARANVIILLLYIVKPGWVIF